MANYKKQYRDLEMSVHNALRDAVNASDYTSRYIECKAIKLTDCNYTELSVWNDKLILLDHDGYHYSAVFALDLEQLIDILHQEQP